MTKRRELEHHRDSLDEIGEILSSMKTLAYMETRKLSRFLAAQQDVVESITDVAADFLSFHPELSAALRAAAPVYLVIGSERGFCGDFNRTLCRRLSEVAGDHQRGDVRVVAVGHKLHSLLDGDESVAAFLDGASVVEEVPSVLESLIDTLNSLRKSATGIALYGICHDRDDVVLTALLPPFVEQWEHEPEHAFPPLLNVPAEEFLADLVDHYLFAALNNMLYTSLMAENERRVSHLEGAVRHLEQESGELTRKCRALRQEEIIEEIEVILLSAS
jgi:F-type H+-transporting ATPase subunit gamma